MSQEDWQQNLPSHSQSASWYPGRRSHVERSGSNIPTLGEEHPLSSTEEHQQQKLQLPELLEQPQLWVAPTSLPQQHALQQAQVLEHASQLPVSVHGSTTQVQPSESLLQQLDEQHQHQMLCESATQLGNDAWDDTGQEENVHLLVDKTQRLPAMLPISPTAHGELPKVPQTGIGRFRHQHNAIPVGASISTQPLHPGQSNSEVPAHVKYPSDQHATSQHQTGYHHPQHMHKLPPLVAASKDGPTAPVQEAQVLRRRSSFRQAMQGSDTRSLQLLDMHRSERPAPEALNRLLPVHDDNVGSVSSSGGSFMHRLIPSSIHRSGRVLPEIPRGEVPATYMTGASGPSVGSTREQSHVRATLQHSTQSGSKHSDSKKPKTGGKSSKLAMHSALHQSVLQAKACITQLQQQQREQQVMQQVLQAMNAQTVKMIDDAISAAVEQQWQNPIE